MIGLPNETRRKYKSKIPTKARGMALQRDHLSSYSIKNTSTVEQSIDHNIHSRVHAVNLKSQLGSMKLSLIIRSALIYALILCSLVIAIVYTFFMPRTTLLGPLVGFIASSVFIGLILWRFGWDMFRH
jgi:hypothetical protein